MRHLQSFGTATELQIRLPVVDRLRLLITGQLVIGMAHYTDQKFNVMKDRTDGRLPTQWLDKQP